jgi:hypothetical protein
VGVEAAGELDPILDGDRGRLVQPAHGVERADGVPVDRVDGEPTHAALDAIGEHPRAASFAGATTASAAVTGSGSGTDSDSGFGFGHGDGIGYGSGSGYGYGYWYGYGYGLRRGRRRADRDRRAVLHERAAAEAARVDEGQAARHDGHVGAAIDGAEREAGGAGLEPGELAGVVRQPLGEDADGAAGGEGVEHRGERGLVVDAGAVIVAARQRHRAEPAQAARA